MLRLYGELSFSRLLASMNSANGIGDSSHGQLAAAFRKDDLAQLMCAVEPTLQNCQFFDELLS